MRHVISGILTNTIKNNRAAKRKRVIKLVGTTRWQYCLKHEAYSTKTIALWPSRADSVCSTCLQLQRKMDVFKEDICKLEPSTSFVLILLPTSTVQQVLVLYRGSDPGATTLLDFNTTRARQEWPRCNQWTYWALIFSFTSSVSGEEKFEAIKQCLAASFVD